MSDNSAAMAALEAAIAKIERIGIAPKAIAPAVAKECLAIITANVAAGRAPDGSAWKPKANGEKPLKNAAAHVTAEAHGSRVVITLTGPEAFHHRGRTRGNIVRAIIPGRKLPQPFTDAIHNVLKRWIAGHGD